MTDCRIEFRCVADAHAHRHLRTARARLNADLPAMTSARVAKRADCGVLRPADWALGAGHPAALSVTSSVHMPLIGSAPLQLRLGECYDEPISKQLPHNR
eukprot:4169368-Prymnesium_polylepis.1